MLLLLACQGSVSDSGPLATEGELSLLTYNVHGLPEAITGDDTAGRIRQIGPLLPGYDFVGLQEDFREEDHQVLEEGGGYAESSWFGEPLDDRIYGSGLAWLSELPVLEHEGVNYAGCHGVTDNASDCLASKGYQRIRVRLGAAELDLYNTHLEAGGGEEDDAVRAEQVDALLEAFERDSAGLPIVLLGDTNLNDDDPEDLVEIDRIKAAGFEDACDLLGCPTPGRIDRYLLREGGGVAFEVTHWEVPPEFVDEQGVDLSDHEPIEIQMDWRVE